MCIRDRSSRGRARRRGKPRILQGSRDLSLRHPVPACHSRRTRRSIPGTGRPTSPRSHIVYRRTNHKYLLYGGVRDTGCDGRWPGHEWRCLLHLSRSPSRALVGCAPCGSWRFYCASAAVLGLLLVVKLGERCAWLPPTADRCRLCCPAAIAWCCAFSRSMPQPRWLSAADLPGLLCVELELAEAVVGARPPGRRRRSRRTRRDELGCFAVCSFSRVFSSAEFELKACL